jgi:putative Holliday junction resolvase
MEREEGDFVVLTDENGEEHEFELVDVFDLDGKEYAVLASADADDDDEEAIVLRVERDGEGHDVLVDIEDDEEWERVAARWDEILEEESVLEWDPEDDEDESEESEGTKTKDGDDEDGRG